MRMICFIVALIGALAVPSFAAPKNKKTKKNTGLSSVLGELHWGTSSIPVIRQIQEGIEAKYTKKTKKMDVLLVDKMMRKKRRELKGVKKAHIRFHGQQTGFEASLIAEAYRDNAGESMILIDDGAAQRYFFFRDEQLWKIMVVYSSSVARRTDFSAFVRQVGKKYGRSVKKVTKKGTKEVVKAIWRDAKTELWVENHSLFNTYAMIFLQKGRGVEIEVTRPVKAGATAVRSARSDSMIADIMEEGGGAQADVVDRITGTQHSVDLNLGETQYEPLRRAVDAPKKRSQKGKNARKTKRDVRPEQAPVDPTGDGSGVIIY